MSGTMRELTCIRCEKKLMNIMPTMGFQPNNGLAFYTQGHYGSTYFDPMDGSYLQCAICDSCVEAFEREGMMFRSPLSEAQSTGEKK